LGPRAGGTASTNPAKALYLPNEKVALTAAPEAGRQFLGWLGDAAGSENPVVLTMDRNRVVAAQFSLDQGEVIWPFDPEGSLVEPPSIGPDGTLYVAASWPRPAVYAIDGLTGCQRWELRIGDDGYFTMPVLSPYGLLYTMSNGRTYAVDPATGTRKWSYDGSFQGLSVGPTGWVFLRSSEWVEAVDGATGERRWQRSLTSETGSAVTVSADNLVYVARGGLAGQKPPPLTALDGATGQTRWDFQPEAGLWQAPSIGADGTVFCAGSLFLWALNGATGELRWRTDFGGGLIGYGPLIGPAGRVYVTVSEDAVGTVLVALDGRNGEVLWRTALRKDTWLSGSPVLAADGSLLCLTPPWLSAFDATDGSLRCERELEFLSQGGGGRLVLGPADQCYVLGGPLSRLLAIQGGPGLAQAPWPTHRGDLGNTGLGRGPVRIEGPGLEGSVFKCPVRTIPGTTYQLQGTASLGHPEWMPVATVNGNGSEQLLSDPDPSGSRRFYRLETTRKDSP
jgi:hypothetical protein